MTNRQMFDAVMNRLDRMDERFDRVEERLDKLEERLDRVEERLDKLEESHTALTERVDAMESDLERKITELQVVLETRVIPPLQEMAACYASTYFKYVQGVCRDRRTVVDVKQIKRTVAGHADRLRAAGL